MDPSILHTLGPERTVMIIEVSSFQGLEMYLAIIIVDCSVPVTCVHLRGVLQFGVWIRGVHCSPDRECCYKYSGKTL